MLVDLEEGLKRKHAPTLVGYWCAAYDAVVLATAQLGLKVVYWAASTKGRHRHFADRGQGTAESAAQKQVVLVFGCPVHCILLVVGRKIFSAQGGWKIIGWPHSVLSGRLPDDR
jgi:hypothetical protein